MAEKTFEINGLDELYAALERVGEQAVPLAEKAMETTLRYLRQMLPPYPNGQAGEMPKVYTRQPQKRKWASQKQRKYFFWALRQGLITVHEGPYQSKFKSAKQQAYVFWAVREGKVTIPYVRTNKLEVEITTETRVAGSEVLGIIGTNLAYARYVIGDQQAPIHQGRWWQLESEVERNLAQATQVFTAELWRGLQAAFRE